MKRELGIARCGLACCLCSEGAACPGCHADGCRDGNTCETRRCSTQRGLDGCYQCDALCRRGLLAKDKPYAFTLFARQWGVDALLDCLEENERSGIVYHRAGLMGDYDGFHSVEDLLAFIQTGKKEDPC